MAKRETSGQITELERGRRYSIRVRLAPDENHEKWHWSKSRKVEGNKAEATAALVAYKKELENPEDDISLPLREYAEAFQENRKALGKVSELTLERDKIDIKRIVKYLGGIEITELDAPSIEKAYVEMFNDGASKDAVHKTHMKLKQIMRKAFNEGLIVRNPCDAVDGITRPKQDPDKKKERRFTKEEAVRFAQTLKEYKKTGKIVATWLALTTGMRRGEVLALTWKDIDLKNKRIHIRKQFGKEKTLKEPKTTKSKRVVSIDDETFALLTQWRDDQAQEFEKADLKQSDNSPVCSNELCDFIDPDNFSRWRRDFYVANGFAHYEKEEKWIDSRGIERIKRTGYIGPNFHALRHAQATLLVAGGVDPKTVQARLGHEKISTTLEIYAEAVEENDRSAANYIDSILGGK